MIRPFTLVCMVLAGGSGLYLYQSKHQAQMLDREIGKTVKQTEAARERIGMLRAEWALLNEPDRLADLARAHTALQPLKPAQFVALNDLASRLPAPVVPGRPSAEPETEEAPIAQAAPPSATPTQGASVAPAAEAKPEPKPIVVAEPKPAPIHRPIRPTPSLAATPGPAEVATAQAHGPGRPVAPPHPVVPYAVNADATAPGTVGAAVLRAMRAQNNPAAAPAYVQPIVAPAPTYAPASAYSAPATGSLLGGSRGSLAPPVPYAAR